MFSQSISVIWFCVLFHLCERGKEKVIRKRTDDYQWAPAGHMAKQPKPENPPARGSKWESESPDSVSILSLFTCVYVRISWAFSKKLFIQSEGSVKITRPFAVYTKSFLTCPCNREFQWLESIPENPRDRVAWCTTVHRITKENWTKLKWPSTHTHSTEFC